MFGQKTSILSSMKDLIQSPKKSDGHAAKISRLATKIHRQWKADILSYVNSLQFINFDV